MPLKIGTSKETLVDNFKTEKSHGKKEDQAWAIAFETRRRAKKKKKKGGNYKRHWSQVKTKDD